MILDAFHFDNEYARFYHQIIYREKVVVMHRYTCNFSDNTLEDHINSYLATKGFQFRINISVMYNVRITILWTQQCESYKFVQITLIQIGLDLSPDQVGHPMRPHHRH